VPIYRQDLDGTWIAKNPGYQRDRKDFWVRDSNGSLVIHEDKLEGYLVRRYRPRIEGLFARIEHWTDTQTGKSHWRSISKDNITTLYGKDDNSRIFDPDHQTHIFSWLICESYDDKGNVICYEYKEENSDFGNDVVVLSQAHEANRKDASREVNRYLKHIYYGNRVSRLVQPVLAEGDWLFHVVFDYGEHSALTPQQVKPWQVRKDPFSSYRSGFEIRTYRLCQRVLTFHHIPDLDLPDGTKVKGYDGLVRSTEFKYSDGQNLADSATPIYSRLMSVTQKGYKQGVAPKSLPPLEFTYSEPIIDETVREVDPQSLENLPQGLDGTRYQWVDLDGEGLSGILTEQAGAWFYSGVQVG
jgi:hypothetical protein